LASVLLAAVGPAAAWGEDDVLKLSGVKGGLVVHVGCGNGEFTATLCDGRKYLVHGLDADAANVEKARAHLGELGLHGTATVEHFDGRHLPYVDNLVNLLIANDPGDVSMDEVMRVLTPGGVAMIGGTETVKPRPEQFDDWTHWLYDAGNNAVSRDKAVGVSRSLQWTMPPLSGRHHNLLPSVAAMVSAGGRLYCIIDEAPVGVRGPGGKWSLVARDAFNGLFLWRRPMTEWGWQHWSDVQVGGLMRFKGPDQLYRRLVAAGDVVYVTLGFRQPVVALDGATGETIRVYQGTENTAAICHRDGTLFLTRNVAGRVPGKDLLAVDAETGRILWQRKGFTGITSRGDELKAFTDAYLTVGDEHVFFLDRDDVVALDIETGQTAWTHPRPAMRMDVFGHYDFNFANFCTLVYHQGRLFLGQIDPTAVNLNGWQQKDLALLALDAASGKKLWEHTGMTLAHFTPPDLFVRGGLVWTLEKETVALCGLDVQTGEVRRRYPVKEMLVGHHHRCYRNKATARFYLAGEEGIEYIDFDSGTLDVHHWLRGACGYGLMPANGLIYMPTHACGCHNNVKLNGFFALSSRKPRSTRQPTATTRKRLEEGPAFGRSVVSDTATSDVVEDWPVYKHDNRRSNHARTDVPTRLRKRWEQPLAGQLTPPIIAGNRVFVASPTSNAVYCLNADSGERRWQFITDGPVDTPPTYHAGRLLFGTRGGSVYALDPHDGALIWRFRAAPDDLRLTAFGRLESLWPVHGSVLVLDDRVYCVAGRSMHLDTGLYVYVLDLPTGKVLQHANLKADIGPKGELGGAVLPDLLVGDENGITMRQMRFDPEDIANHVTAAGGSFLRVNDGGLLDATWINNNFWRYGPAQGQMLVFDGTTAFGIRGPGKLITKSYGQDVFAPGTDGYLLSAVGLGKQPGVGSRDDRRGKAAPKPQWQRRVAVRAQGMVVTDAHLFLAGTPDVMDVDAPWAAFEGRRGGVLEVYDKTDGTKLAECRLDKPPVFDGLAAAGRRLFLTTTDGRIVCMAGR